MDPQDRRVESLPLKSGVRVDGDPGNSLGVAA